ncbi:hypothetical protein N7G274_006416 [Stereocaulon virgatum]|uniref:Rhodopsin domain-containing protein n=1 Tax=Stereocaulon virgatum TaxID=373712 RepID=A0ABR4AC69_9LECA
MGQDNRSPSIEVMCLFFIFSSIVISASRVVARLQSAAGLWWDDWFSLMALIFVVALNLLGYVDARHGLGKHVASISPSDATLTLRSLYFDGWIYNFALSLAKLSVLCFYQRIFATARKTRIFLWITAGLTTIWLTAVTLAGLIHCIPVKAFWNPMVKGKCIDSWSFFLGSAVPSIVLDLILLVVPMPFLWRLQIGATQKIALFVIFLLGYLNPVISFVRLAYLIKLKSNIQNPDVTWNLANLAIWSIAECSVALISASVPSLQFLFNRVVGRCATPRNSTAGARYGSHKEGPGAPIGVVKRSGSFTRLRIERVDLGFSRIPDNYEVAAYRKGNSNSEGMELRTSKGPLQPHILVSRSVDVVSHQVVEASAQGVEHV